jgi:SAM-dependent methyltransferase
MKECSKSIVRRLADSNFTRRYFVGRGVDIGGKPDPLALYTELFPLLEEVRTWDWEDGDAQVMAGVPDASFDFVHSSHCLEHLVDPYAGLASWFRVLRPGGHLIITVPDEDLYEQGEFPSTFNRDHKWTFTVHKTASWSERSVNLLDLLRSLGAAADILRLEVLHASYRFELPRYDQTLSPVGECGIEFVVRKRDTRELADRGRWRRSTEQPGRELRIHLNQHRDDLQTLKRANQSQPPFSNDAPL